LELQSFINQNLNIAARKFILISGADALSCEDTPPLVRENPLSARGDIK
jgi:hypothetical protein